VDRDLSEVKAEAHFCLNYLWIVIMKSATVIELSCGARKLLNVYERLGRRKRMNSCRRSTVVLVAVLSMAGICAMPAHATSFTFSDEYYISSSTAFYSTFGTSLGYSSAGIYQETNSGNPTITRLGNGSSVPGEFIQNSTPNAADELALFGWGQSLHNGQQVAIVYNTADPINGANTYFQYKVGGVTAPFTFNGFDLKGATANSNLQFTLEGLDSANHVLDSAILTVTGNSFQTETLDWTGITTVEIASTLSLPVNWGSGTLYMDNIEINNPVDPVPESSTLVLLGMGLLALSYARRVRVKTISVNSSITGN
jgi:hypothetical protein